MSFGGKPRCWSHKHFLAKNDDGDWTVPVTNENFKELRNAKAKLVCKNCLAAQKQLFGNSCDAPPPHVFSWDPSTTRKIHLMMKCPSFKLTDEYKSAEVQTALQKHKEDLAKTQNV